MIKLFLATYLEMKLFSATDFLTAILESDANIFQFQEKIKWKLDFDLKYF
jgi:hypothetical protein